MDEYTKELEQQLSELEARAELLAMAILYSDICQYCEDKLIEERAKSLLDSSTAARALLRKAKGE